MLTNFIICLKAVLPIFIYLAIGMVVRKMEIVDAVSVKKMNRFVFTILFPPVMFDNLYGKNIAESLDPLVIGLAIAGVLSVYFFVWFATGGKKMADRPGARGAMIQAIYRSNLVLMGIPIAKNIYGHGNLGITAVVIAIIVPMFNVLAVIDLEYFGQKQAVLDAEREGIELPKRQSSLLRTVFLGILKNPLIIGAVAGIVLTLLKVQLPTFATDILGELGGAATPLALILLGASFNLKSAAANKKEVILCVLGRLVIVPAIFLPIAALLGIRGINFVTLVSVFASPCAVTSYTMAEVMNCDGKLAGDAVVFTSAFASLTLFLWLFVSKSLGLF